MIHAMGWLGYESSDFQQQGLCETYLHRDDGKPRPIDPLPKNVDGVFFGYMHRSEPGIYVATRARYMDLDVLLSTPVVLVKAQHTDGKGFGPKPSRFGDESAARLLSDMIAVNPALEAPLRKLATKAGLILAA